MNYSRDGLFRQGLGVLFCLLISVGLTQASTKKDIIGERIEGEMIIKMKHSSKVFDKFFRVPTGNIHNVKGFGLGLYYVKSICKSHHWKIEMESKEGEGTEFIIQIPNN